MKKMSKVAMGWSLLVLSSVSLSSVGCGEVVGTDSTDDSVAQRSSAQSSFNPTIILLTDNRTAPNAVLTLQNINPGGPTDWEDVRTTLYPPGVTPHNQALMSWTSQAPNYLQLLGVGQGIYPDFPNYSSIKIADYSGGPTVIMRVTLRAYIDGYCHEDYEDIDWSTPPLLYFNGNGATWDGSCYRGNLLRTYQ